MSCFLLSDDHIGYLVNLGCELDIQGVMVGDRYRPIDLHDEHDRRYVAGELLAANRMSVANHCGDPIVLVGNVPTIECVPVPLFALPQLAQALQWVRSYQYQSCDHRDWRTTYAYQFTTRLADELISDIIGHFDTRWTYDGPTLVSHG